LPLGRPPRIREVIWLEPQDYVDLDKVYQPFSKVLATNQFIVHVLRAAIHNSEAWKLVMPALVQAVGEGGVELPTVEVERKVAEITCPFCFRDFSGSGLRGLREHLAAGCPEKSAEAGKNKEEEVKQVG
jgi:hypothetical protein